MNNAKFFCGFDLQYWHFFSVSLVPLNSNAVFFVYVHAYIDIRYKKTVLE